MIDLRLALQLRDAGLQWRPARRDTFTLPNSDLAHEIFTLTDVTILLENIKGELTVTFHGSAEWALDDVRLAEVVWLPSETQLREEIQLRLGGESPSLALHWTIDGFRCVIRHLDQEHAFEEASAEHAYAMALLFVLQREQLSRARTEPDA
jgi:hypothetical protein